MTDRFLHIRQTIDADDEDRDVLVLRNVNIDLFDEPTEIDQTGDDIVRRAIFTITNLFAETLDEPAVLESNCGLRTQRIEQPAVDVVEHTINADRIRDPQ